MGPIERERVYPRRCGASFKPLLEVQIPPNGRFARILWTHGHAVDGKQHDGWHPGVPTKNGILSSFGSGS
eukprot:gene10516-biopygen4781